MARLRAGVLLVKAVKIAVGLVVIFFLVGFVEYAITWLNLLTVRGAGIYSFGQIKDILLGALCAAWIVAVLWAKV